MAFPDTLDGSEAIENVIRQRYGRRTFVHKDIDSPPKLEVLRRVSSLQNDVWLVERSAQSTGLFLELKLDWQHFCLVADGRIQTLSSKPPRSQIEHILDYCNNECGVCKKTLNPRSTRACTSCNFKTCAPCGMKEAIDAYTATDRMDHCPNPECSYAFQMADPRISFCYLSQVWNDICNERKKGLSEAEAREVLDYGKEKIKNADAGYYRPFGMLPDDPENPISLELVLKLTGRLK